MHKIAAAILLLAFFGQTFNQGFCYLGYVIDKAAYVKNCVNKARPKMKCNGKCQLMKKIEEQEKREQQQAPELKLASKAEVISSKSFFVLFTPVFGPAKKLDFIIANAGSPVDQPSFHFHPPNA